MWKGKVLRTELCVNNPYDLGIKRSIVNLGYLGEVGHRITGRYLDNELGIDERFLARHNLAELAKTEQRGDKRITGIRIDDQRIMGVIEALVHSSNLVSHFTNKSLRKEVHRIRSIGEDEYGSTKMGYDLKRLAVKGIVKKVEGRHRYIFTKTGHKICVMLLLLKSRVIEPLLSGILAGVKTGSNHIKSKIIESYEKLNTILDDIFDFAGLKKSQILVQNTRSP